MTGTRQTRVPAGLATPLQYLPGVGPARAKLLARKGLETVADALFFVPHRHEDRTRFTPFRALAVGSAVLVALVSGLISYEVPRSVFGRAAEQRRVVQDDPIVQRAVELTRGVRTQKDLLTRVGENQGRRGE